MISQEKQDKIYNALIVGMALEDAYIYANLTPDEIAAVTVDTRLQQKWQSILKGFELGLLEKLSAIAEKQSRMGREQAVTWSLEHMFPRYGGKQQVGGTVHIHMKDTDPGTLDTVEIKE